jgi:glycosyltransferase involved in cell wall biosynthesis
MPCSTPAVLLLVATCGTGLAASLMSEAHKSPGGARNGKEPSTDLAADRASVVRESINDLALIFAYHFPPENVIGALRPFRLYKYLSRLGYCCHVISAADVRQVSGLDAQFVPDPFVERARQGFGWQVERVIRRFLLPGVVGSQWSIHAYRAALRYLDRNPHHRVTVFSSAPPVGTHVAAYWLARRRKIPWIADFRDPLADNPIYAQISPFTKNVYRKLEKIFVNAADFVIANTDSAQEKLRRTYPRRADRIQLVWNGFDPENRLLPLPVAAGDRKVIAHIGELYGGRSASPILHSLRRLIDRGRLSPASFKVHLAGPIVENSVPDPAFNARALSEGWLQIDSERVPQAEAHQMMQTAHALLLIQPQSILQVPGKLFEYLQIGRPILAFVPPDSPVERILSQSGVPYQCVYPALTESELDASILQFFELQASASGPNEWFESQFNAQSHAQKISDLIQLANRRSTLPDVLSHAAQEK